MRVAQAGSRLASALGRDRCPVNSRHHQGVAEPGPGLRVCARADDGTIEAVEAEGSDFTLGVQWHPESLEAEHRARLFGAFVSACRPGARCRKRVGSQERRAQLQGRPCPTSSWRWYPALPDEDR